MSDVTAKRAALRCAEIAAESLHRPTMPGGTVDAIRTYAATLPADEGTVRVPVEWLKRSKREHHICEDCWYSCPLSAEGCCDDYQVECNCGAEQWNAEVDALLAAAKEGA